ncbi:hypothetical protein [Altibacter sp. HG106]|uniref:hypothetical protein n=1 Tax=Altibacter sp. HG106 TaxID=3023937 RepID=UPI002350E82C|nr:hypothetical protein [Altibacter sp. HG106]MDC7995741.1 hypothetical protein [Altibacter sp. HG106]
MAQDIRSLLKEDTSEPKKLSKGHEARFEARLAAAFPEEKKKKRPAFLFMKIAAVGLVLLTLSIFGYRSLTNESTPPTIVDTDNTSSETPLTPQITLGDLSPDLKKVEEFYTAGINVQLASLDTSNENKDLIDGYMRRLKDLDAEYTRLTQELNTLGPTEATINALIDNLKLRLELLFKLKNKLKELKETDDEKYINMEA